MDAWGWSDDLAPWLAARVELPIGALFCVIDGPTRGPPWSATAARCELRHATRWRPACGAGLRRISSVMLTLSSSLARGCRCR